MLLPIMVNAADSTDWVKELEILMQRLRGPDGCPWDREQDHRSLKRYLIEEVYELIDAIDDEDDGMMVDELGDVLLQVVFHCTIANEQKRFSLQDAARVCCEKLTRRHPHVFGDAEAGTAEDVLEIWQAVKAKEKDGTIPASLLDGLPRHLPNIQRAEQVQARAAKAGFDWPATEDVLGKVEEEVGEIREALSDGDEAAVAEELGDLMLVVINLCRRIGAEPDELLGRGVRKFERRFRWMETQLQIAGSTVAGTSAEELDRLWNEAKAADLVADGRS